MQVFKSEMQSFSVNMRKQPNLKISKGNCYYLHTLAPVGPAGPWFPAAPSLPFGPALPSLPSGPVGPWAPVAPRGPWGPGAPWKYETGDGWWKVHWY